MAVTFAVAAQLEDQRTETSFPLAYEPGTGRDRNAIRRGIPTISSLLGFQREIRIRRKEDEQRRRRVLKGKQVAVDHDDAECQVRASSGAVHSESPRAPIQSPPIEKAVALSEHGRQPASPLLKSGSQLPDGAHTGPSAQSSDTQVQATDTPSERPTTSGPSTRSGSASKHAQTISSSDSDTIPVKIPLSKLERLKQVKFRNSMELKAREIPLKGDEIKKLRAFSEFVGTPNQIALFGRQLPQCHRYVVKLELNGQEQTYICIEGLKREEDIRDFYAVMSQGKYRKYYEGWKICFRMVEVSGCAAVISSSGQNLGTMPANCHIDLVGGSRTLCGSSITLKTEHGERTSTIGGIVQLGAEFYALTTAHSSLWLDSTTSTIVMSKASVLKEEDFGDDVEEILVLSEDATPVELTPAERDGLAVKGFELTVDVHEHQKDDWCLIPVGKKYQLPNAHWSPERSLSSTVINEVYRADPGGVGVYGVLGGTLEYIGSMAYAPSFLDGLHGPIEVWAVSPRSDSGRDVGRGDSGCWFATLSGNEVVGSLVAKSHGKALITLLSSQLESISRYFSPESRAILPRPETMLLLAANNYLALEPGASDQFVGALFDLVRQTHFIHSILTFGIKNALRTKTVSIPELKELITGLSTGLETALKNVPEKEYAVSTPESPPLVRLAFIYHTPPAERPTVHWEIAEDSTSAITSTGPERVDLKILMRSGRHKTTRSTNLYLSSNRATGGSRFSHCVAGVIPRKLLACAICTVYFGGIGVVVWQLIISSLNNELKVALGVGLLAFHFAAAIGLLLRSMWL